jgi:hypothetical protein
VLCAAGLLSACAGPSDAVRNSQPYQLGYSDGCAAATAAGASYRYGPVKNEEAFHSNDAYRAGWNTGYSACRQGIQMPGSDPTHPIPEPNPGH